MSGFNLDIKSEEDFDKDNSDFEMAEKSENCELYREEIIKSWDKCIGCDQSINNMFMYKERSYRQHSGNYIRIKSEKCGTLRADREI